MRGPPFFVGGFSYGPANGAGKAPKAQGGEGTEAQDGESPGGDRAARRKRKGPQQEKESVPMAKKQQENLPADVARPDSLGGMARRLASPAHLAALCRRTPAPMGGCYTEKPLLVR